MITINGHSYSGNIIDNEDNTLSVLIKTIDTIGDVVSAISQTSEVLETVGDRQTVYTVSVFRTASSITKDTYVIEYSTKPTFREQIEARLQEQSDTIDELLIMALGI